MQILDNITPAAAQDDCDGIPDWADIEWCRDRLEEHGREEDWATETLARWFTNPAVAHFLLPAVADPRGAWTA